MEGFLNFYSLFSIPINLLFGFSFRRQNLSPPSPYTKIGISAEVENCKKLPKNSVRMYDFSSFPVIRLIKKLHPFFSKKKKKWTYPYPEGKELLRPISDNLRLNFKQGFFISLFQSLFGIIFPILLRASKNQILDKHTHAHIYIYIAFSWLLLRIERKYRKSNFN